MLSQKKQDQRQLKRLKRRRLNFKYSQTDLAIDRDNHIPGSYEYQVLSGEIERIELELLILEPEIQELESKVEAS